MTAGRIDWPAVVDRAREMVESYDTSVKLRQLFYRLVSAQVIPNSQVAYKRLSAVTAEARRDKTFPALIDRGRTIHEYQSFTGTGHALTWLFITVITKKNRYLGFAGTHSGQRPPEP